MPKRNPFYIFLPSWNWIIPSQCKKFDHISCPVSPCHFDGVFQEVLHVFFEHFPTLHMGFRRCPLTLGPLPPGGSCLPKRRPWFFLVPPDHRRDRRSFHTEKKSTKVEATTSMEAASWKMYQSQSKAFFCLKKHQIWQNKILKKLRTKICVCMYKYIIIYILYVLYIHIINIC